MCMCMHVHAHVACAVIVIVPRALLTRNSEAARMATSAGHQCASPDHKMHLTSPRAHALAQRAHRTAQRRARDHVGAPPAQLVTPPPPLLVAQTLGPWLVRARGIRGVCTEPLGVAAASARVPTTRSAHCRVLSWHRQRPDPHRQRQSRHAAPAHERLTVQRSDVTQRQCTRPRTAAANRLERVAAVTNAQARAEMGSTRGRP